MGDLTHSEYHQIINTVFETGGVDLSDYASSSLRRRFNTFFINNNIEDNLAELMAILFRPIVERKNKIYTIESYDAEITIRAEAMKKMSGQQVQNAMVFFWIFGKELLRILPLYLMELSLKKIQELKDLEKDGVGLV